jgi:hypothetical protein
LTTNGFKVGDNNGKTVERKGIIPNFSDIIVKTIKTNLGIFDFYQFKPGGYWNKQNFVVQTDNTSNKSRIGTFDINSEKLFMKDWNTPQPKLYGDENFNEIIRLSDLKASTQKCTPPLVFNPTNGKCEMAKKGGNGTSKYIVCNDFPYKLNCKSEVIRKVQQCLGTKDDSLLGTATENALKANGYSLPLTKEMYDKIVATCGGGGTQSPKPSQPEPEQPTAEDGENIDTLN